MEENNLESLRLQLVSSLNALKQQEESLAFVETNEAQQQEAIDTFKSEIDSALSSLASLPHTFQQSSNQIDFIHNIAQDLSWRINIVDVAYSRCKETAKYVQHFADLSECLADIPEYIEKGDIPMSCNFISRLLQIPEELLTQDNKQKINAARLSTLNLLRKELQKETDPATVFKYFTECGARAEGVKEFANLHHAKIVEETNPNYVKLNQTPPSNWSDDQPAPHVAAFVYLLNLVATHVNEAAATLNDAGQLSVFIRLLTDICDDKIEAICRLYAEYRGIPISQNHRMREVKSANDCDNTTFLNSVNQEIAQIAHQFNEWETYLKNKMKSGISSEIFTEYKFDRPTSKGSGMSQDMKARRAVQELLTQYVGLSVNYVRLVTASLLGPISKLSDDEKVSECIDDAFYVYRDVVSRSISTNSVITTNTIFNVISEKIGELSDILRKESFGMRTPELPPRCAILLNALDMTSVYLSKLVSFVEAGVMKQFKGDDSSILEYSLNDLKRLSELLSERRDSLLKDAVAANKDGIDALVRPFQNKGWTNEARGAITVDVEAYLQGQVSASFGRLSASFKAGLNQANFALFRGRVATIFASKMELILKDSRFDSRGALLFDRMVRFFVSFFGSEEPFRRLTQVAYVINLESPDDLREALGPDAPFEWIFTNEGIREIVNLRLDWKGAVLPFLK